MSAAHTREETFRKYDASQSARYASDRRAYHPSVYQTVIEQHTSTGGGLEHVVDLGCGPGLATKELARHFTHATGLDASEAMIATAQKADLHTAASHPVRFAVSSAEEMDGLAPSSVDLLTAANAAHWFDMPVFWARAAHVLKPSGSVAVWTTGESRAHPSVPNATAINAAIDDHARTFLAPYLERGNVLARGAYRDLTMPWDAGVDPAVAQSFDRASLFRRDWDGPGELFLVDQDRELDLDTLERALATGSPVQRWRDAHPADVGTERDVVRVLRRRIEALLREAGVPEGEERIRGIAPGAVVVVKKVGVEGV